MKPLTKGDVYSILLGALFTCWVLWQWKNWQDFQARRQYQVFQKSLAKTSLSDIHVIKKSEFLKGDLSVEAEEQGDPIHGKELEVPYKVQHSLMFVGLNKSQDTMLFVRGMASEKIGNVWEMDPFGVSLPKSVPPHGHVSLGVFGDITLIDVGEYHLVYTVSKTASQKAKEREAQ